MDCNDVATYTCEELLREMSGYRPLVSIFSFEAYLPKPQMTFAFNNIRMRYREAPLILGTTDIAM